MEEEINYQSKEENVIWDLEVWKRSEEIKFKAYLKQLEYEFLSKINEEYQKKEEDREKELKMKLNELNVLHTKSRKRINEVEEREKRVSLMEEELKLKITEVARQLANKEEEIAYIKNRFRDEKKQLEKDKQSLQKTIVDKDRHIEEIEISFKSYKKEIDDSPISILKNELNRKSLEYEDLSREKLRVEKDRECLKHNCEKLKMDLIKMKKAFDSEKELIYKQKLDEIVKFDLFRKNLDMKYTIKRFHKMILLNYKNYV
jgi:chromosome segregation ATPase